MAFFVHSCYCGYSCWHFCHFGRNGAPTDRGACAGADCGEIIEVRRRRGQGADTEYYVHYIDYNRRLDEWVTRDRLKLDTSTPAPMVAARSDGAISAVRHIESAGGTGAGAVTAAALSSTTVTVAAATTAASAPTAAAATDTAGPDTATAGGIVRTPRKLTRHMKRKHDEENHVQLVRVPAARQPCRCARP